MNNLIDKYLGEALGRGMLKLVHTKNPTKLISLLNKKGIKYTKMAKGIMVGDDDYDDVEELMARNNLL